MSLIAALLLGGCITEQEAKQPIAAPPTVIVEEIAPLPEETPEIVAEAPAEATEETLEEAPEVAPEVEIGEPEAEPAALELPADEPPEATQ
jgi:hypothetical protein